MSESESGLNELDTRILNVLISEQRQGHNLGFFMTTKRIGMELGIDNLKKIAGKLQSMEHQGLVEGIRVSSKIRWRATMKGGQGGRSQAVERGTVGED